jgi:hypothetical protein
MMVVCHGTAVPIPGTIDRNSARSWTLMIQLDCSRSYSEETGFTAREWARSGILVISYFLFHRIYRGLSLPQRQRAFPQNWTQVIEVFTASIDDLLAWCAEGLVTDAVPKWFCFGFKTFCRTMGAGGKTSLARGQM